MRAFTEGIASALVRDFDDRVLMIVAEPSDEAREPSLDDSAGLARLTVFVPADDPVEASRRLLQAIDQHWQDRAYLFVEPSALGPAFTDQMVNQIGDADLDERLFRKLVQIQTDEEQPLQSSADTWRRLRTRLLTGDAPCRRRSTRRQIAAWFRDEAISRWVKHEREPQAERYPAAMHGDEFVRIRMAYQPTPSGTAAGSFDHWARAVSNRRVGLALGGSGAWGYAHAAYLYIEMNCKYCKMYTRVRAVL